MTATDPDDEIKVELRRIADALDRAFPLAREAVSLSSEGAYRLDGQGIEPIGSFRPLPLHLIVGIDRQKTEMRENLDRHANGTAAHDSLLWGVRGTGKSALVKSVIGDLRAKGLPISLVEVAAHNVDILPSFWSTLAQSKQRICMFIDDIGYEGAGAEARRVRSMLDGGVEQRPDNVRLVVTSNQRNIVERKVSDQSDPLNDRDVTEDALALADRFGLKLGFQRPSQDDYLAIVSAYADHFNLDWEERDALAFAHQRGDRSGRTAWHFLVELAGTAGRRLDY